MPDNAQQDFLKDLEPEQKTDVFDQPIEPVVPTEETPEEPEDTSNRQLRRLQKRYEAERESAIALAAKVEVLTSAQRAQAEVPSEYLKKIERLYGTDSPEAQAATQLLSDALKGVEDRATERALEAFRAEQQQEADAVGQNERTLDSMVEDIEDTFNVTMDAQTQKGFFQLLEKLSPKDHNGNIIEYADAHAVFEELQARRAPAQNRAKDLAARSMVKTGASPDTNVQDDAALRFLKDNGII